MMNLNFKRGTTRRHFRNAERRYCTGMDFLGNVMVCCGRNFETKKNGMKILESIIVNTEGFIVALWIYCAFRPFTIILTLKNIVFIFLVYF